MNSKAPSSDHILRRPLLCSYDCTLEWPEFNHIQPRTLSSLTQYCVDAGGGDVVVQAALYGSTNYSVATQWPAQRLVIMSVTDLIFVQHWTLHGSTSSCREICLPTSSNFPPLCRLTTSNLWMLSRTCPFFSCFSLFLLPVQLNFSQYVEPYSHLDHSIIPVGDFTDVCVMQLCRPMSHSPLLCF